MAGLAEAMKKVYPKDEMDFLTTYLHEYFYPAHGKKIEDADDLGLVLRAHLLAELLMDLILKKNVKCERMISRRELTFSMKLTIIESFGLIPEKFILVLEQLNSIRNQFAHDLRTSFKSVDFGAISREYAYSPVNKKYLLFIRKRLKTRHALRKDAFMMLMGSWLTNLVFLVFDEKELKEIKAVKTN